MSCRRSTPCECPRPRYLGTPDAGNPPVRCDEGGGEEVAWHAVSEPQILGKPGHRGIPTPKQPFPLPYSTTDCRPLGVWCKRETMQRLALCGMPDCPTLVAVSGDGTLAAVGHRCHQFESRQVILIYWAPRQWGVVGNRWQPLTAIRITVLKFWQPLAAVDRYSAHREGADSNRMLDKYRACGSPAHHPMTP
jgi:hypothetical protein